MNILVGLLPWAIIFGIVFALIYRANRKPISQTARFVQIRPVNCTYSMRIVGGDDVSFHQFKPVIQQASKKKNDYEDFEYETTGLYCPFTQNDD